MRIKKTTNQLIASALLLASPLALQAEPMDTTVDPVGHMKFTSADKNFSMRIGGRIHLDGTFYDNDTATDMTNAIDARRARIELRGTMYKNWDWKLDREFAQTSEVKDGFRDLFVRYTFDNKATSIIIGQFKEFFGLEHYNSSNDLAFVERALPSRTFHDIAEASDGRRIGIAVMSTLGSDFTGAFGVFGRNISGDSKDSVEDPLAVEGRVTYSPVHESGSAIHTALTANYIDLNDPSRGSLSAKPEGKLGSTALISTGSISNADTLSRFGAEFAAIQGPAWFQGEYMVGTFDRTMGDSSVTFAGWHADIGYIVTGEAREYDFASGTVKGPKVSSEGCGAWELAARLSGLDLTDGDIIGGRETNVSAGLNWYPNNNFKFMLTLTKVLDVVGGAFDGQNPSEILFRTQFYF